uniref:Inverted formin-2-like n=1 Tax=Saccoglossus kowalevskii TaxID=10224 RepID=A0ABM0MA06_SACKO|nr:PREDICTED: inverted formin-2-like [Saccoglossus kowalevskii]
MTTKSGLWSKIIQKASSVITHSDASNLQESGPELCIQLLRIPTIQNYAGLKRRIASSDSEWMQEFIELDGIGVLMEVLERVSDRRLSSFSDAYLQLECIGCVKAVMNSQTGLDYIIGTRKNRSCIRKLASGFLSN